MPASNIPFGGTAEEALNYIRGKLYQNSRYEQQVYAFFVEALQTSDAIAAQPERANAELAAAAEEDREYQSEGDVLPVQTEVPVGRGNPHIIEVEQEETEAVFLNDEPDVADIHDDESE